MKLSLKFRDETHHQTPLLRAKIPVTILGFPFLSGVVAGDSSDLSFSLRSNFSSGPSVSLSYHPTIPTTAGNKLPLSISLKSGISFFGSPHNSPLIFSANFNLSSFSNPNFSLQIKPQFGNFSLFKSVSSVDSRAKQLDGNSQNGDLSNGSVPDIEITNGLGGGSDLPLGWKDLSRKSRGFEFLSGVFVAARTSLPVTKRAMVNFRWGMNFPPGGDCQGSRTTLPVLVVNKVSLERVDDEKKVEDVKKIEEAKNRDDVVLKGMCNWMKKEVEDLQRENKEMKKALEGMKLQVPVYGARRDEKEFGKNRNVPSPAGESSSGFDRWRSRKNGGNENEVKEMKKSSDRVNEVENELQKAIKAASS